MSEEKLAESFTDLCALDNKKQAEENPTVTTTTPSEKDDKKIKNDKKTIKMLEHHKYRSKLGGLMNDRAKVSLWSVLKQCVDKELYRFTIPIVWNEPLSLLQRLAENLRYCNELLDKAVDMSNPVDRMKMVAGYLVSSSSIHIARLSKPFNPLLGETYEFTSTRNNYRVCCEQVCHHPPVSAYYAESTRPSPLDPNAKRWKYYGSVYPNIKLNILNACVEAYPNGIQTLEFPEHGEVYTWHNLKVTAHNLILGKLWFEYTGKSEIVNHKLNMKCQLEFKAYSWFSRHMNRCEGYILDSNDNKVALLNGKWDECFFASNDVKNASKFYRLTEKLIEKEETESNSSKFTGLETVWKSNSSTTTDLLSEFYNFSPFTLQLNELFDELKQDTRFEVQDVDKKTKELLRNEITLGPLPATDTRYRPDMRLYENGEVDEASAEKHRLEEKQREKQKKSESGEMPPFKPMWFEKRSHAIVKDEETWSFTDKYWQRDFANCPDIY